MVVNEAQECLGGAGYVEESILPRLYREAPLHSIWEGCGNVQCLDVLRVLRTVPASRDALFAEIGRAADEHAVLGAMPAELDRALSDRDSSELRARWIVERMALALQASILLRGATPEVGLAFCESRLGAAQGAMLGTLPYGIPMGQFITRAAIA
jgi:putative acyl-CoA dehydrogenase